MCFELINFFVHCIQVLAIHLCVVFQSSTNQMLKTNNRSHLKIDLGTLQSPPLSSLSSPLFQLLCGTLIHFIHYVIIIT